MTLRTSRAAGVARRASRAPEFWLVRSPPIAQSAREHRTPEIRTENVTAVGHAMLVGDAPGSRSKAASPNAVGSAAPRHKNWAGQSSRCVFRSNSIRAKPRRKKFRAVREDINPGLTPAAWSVAAARTNIWSMPRLTAKRCSTRLSKPKTPAIAASAFAARFRARENVWLVLLLSNHKETPSRTKQAAVLATIFTGANPQVVRRERWRTQPERPDNPIAMENTLAPEAKTLSLLTKPGSADILMLRSSSIFRAFPPTRPC